MLFSDLGVIDFEKAFSLQESTVEAIASGQKDETVFLLEHPPTFTIGRSGRKENQLADEDFDGGPIQVRRINRGGDITFHGPGQLVGYPHLDLTRRGRDVHRYLRKLEEMLILSVAQFGIAAYRRQGLTGIWTDKGKLASIGVGVRRWITMHGFALNVSTELRFFDLINPCGLRNCPVTSIQEFLNREVPIHKVKYEVIRQMKNVFGDV